MHILDTDAQQHEVAVREAVLLDGHTVARMERRNNTMVLDRYDIPTHLQSKGLGSALLKTLEQHFHREGVTRLVIHIDDALCPIYADFFTKCGYFQDGEWWSKTLTLPH